jgi:hypothetical protein
MNGTTARVLALVLAGLFVLPLAPGMTNSAKAEVWTQTTDADFGSGTLSNLAISGKGVNATLRIAPGLTSLRDWTSVGDNQAGAYYGVSIASAGDVNGDGYDDVIAGAPYYETANSNAGKAYLYLGGATGLAATPSWTSSGDDQAGAFYGVSTGSAGDVNGDGYDDVIIGAQYYNTGNFNAGKAYLYLGGSAGLAATPIWTSSGDNQVGACYGSSVASAGDVDGDGYDDVIIGAIVFDTTNAEAGKAYLYLGGAAGLAATPSWTSSGDDQFNACYGSLVASAGDVNGDGYDDAMVVASGYDTPTFDAGKAYLYLGSEAGLGATAAWTSSGDNQDSAYYGSALAGAGDINGDGYDDVIAGAYAYDTPTFDAGKAYIYLGGSAGLAAAPSWTSSGGNQASAHFGGSAASVGDINGDGYDDVLVAADGYNTVNNNAGKAYMFLGGSAGLGTAETWTSSGDDQGAAFYGSEVASAGDVNGDGYGDFLVAANSYDASNSDVGKAYLYCGIWTSNGDDQAQARFANSIASAGDVNGDGYSDVIVGALAYDTANSNAGKAYLYLGDSAGLAATPIWTSSGDDQVATFYGCSVASAGDVNGDGYDDVIVGAPDYNTANSNAGKAYLYLGGATGLAATPSWTSSGDDQAGAFYGNLVAGAGDVNGDGYNDAMVVASRYDTSNSDVGKVYLYLGGSAGLATTPSWTSSGDDQAGAYYGYSAASAGDVNGDGYGDVIVGAYIYDTPAGDAGKAYLYLGSSTGLGASAAWTSSGDDQSGAFFGCSAMSAGDVNGDGYDDVIIGAMTYTTSSFQEGKVYLYLGSSAGLGASAAWTSSGDNQAEAYYGSSVSGAGDFNGDGYYDVIIAADIYDTANSDVGKVYMYLGSVTGLAGSPSWTSSGDDQGAAFYGSCVASAGDVNDDGCDDIVIGSRNYDTMNADAGKAYLYRGKPYNSGVYTSPLIDSGHSDTDWESLIVKPGDQPAGTKLWVEVEIGGHDILPRQRVPSTAYALNALDVYGQDIHPNPLSSQSKRYLQYRIFFSADDGGKSPSLTDVTVKYTTFDSPLVPVVRVTSPNGGEDWMKDRHYPITWTAEGEFGDRPISLYYSTNNGVAWTLIAANLPNNGTYDWKVPPVTTADAMVKVVATDLDRDVRFDTSDMTFAIDPPPPSLISLTEPTAGALWGVGSHVVSWSLTDQSGVPLTSMVNLSYTMDGENWTALAAGIPNSGHYDWAIGDGAINCQGCVLRVESTDAEGLPITVESGTFTIDTTSPAIESTPPSNMTRGASLHIVAQVSDNFDVGMVQLFYRVDGGEYAALDMVHGDGSVYSADVPAQATGTSLQYYIEAFDGAAKCTTTVANVPIVGSISPNEGSTAGALSWGQVGMGAAMGATVAVICTVVAARALASRKKEDREEKK